MDNIVYLFFDLDGVLINSETGIYRSMESAFTRMGVATPPFSEVKDYIGPPLSVTFAKLNPQWSNDEVNRALGYYIEHFRASSSKECSLYPGVREFLESLPYGFYLFIITTKIEELANDILEQHDILHYFDGVYGSPSVSSISNVSDKQSILANIVYEYDIAPEQALFIGDRGTDIAAAHANGIRAIGVSYGFGSLEELREEKADGIVDRIEDLSGYICGNQPAWI